MTEQTAVLLRAEVTALPGSRLEELLAMYPVLKAEAEDAADRFETLTKAIKAEGSAQQPGVPEITLRGGPGLKPLQLSWRRPWHFNVTRFKEERPADYVQYAERKPRWELREAGS